MASEPSAAKSGGPWRRLTTPLLVCLLPILFLTSAIRVEMNSLGLYAHGFETYDVGATTGLSDEQLVQAARNLILYFNSVSGSPQMVVVNANGTRFDLYHDYELIHLADVKVLFAVNSVAQAVSLLLVVTLVLAGLSFRRRDTVCSGLRYGAIATLALLVTSALAFITNFNQMFVVFHLVAFDNPFWQLNPYTDYLVMLFPLGFWQDMFLIAGSSTGLAAVATYATVALASRSSARARRTAATPNHAKR